MTDKNKAVKGGGMCELSLIPSTGLYKGKNVPYLLLRDRISRSQFLLRTGIALGTLLFGGALHTASAPQAGAQREAASVPSSEAFSKNITRLYVSGEVRHLVTSDKPEEISWGFLPDRDAEPILTVKSGDVVTMDQIT